MPSSCTLCGLVHYLPFARNAPTVLLGSSSPFSIQLRYPLYQAASPGFAPSWTSPVGEVPWQLVSLPSIFPCHLSTTLLQSIFLKCKSNHISFLLKTLSSVASLLHKVQTQHSARGSLLALFQVPTPLFTLFSLPKIHFLPYSFIFQVESWKSLLLWSLYYNHPLTLYF